MSSGALRLPNFGEQLESNKLLQKIVLQYSAAKSLTTRVGWTTLPEQRKSPGRMTGQRRRPKRLCLLCCGSAGKHRVALSFLPMRSVTLEVLRSDDGQKPWPRETSNFFDERTEWSWSSTTAFNSFNSFFLQNGWLMSLPNSNFEIAQVR